MSSVAGQPLPEAAVALRALETKQPFFEDPEQVHPTGDAFKPSRGDIAEGQRRTLPVGVSIFEQGKTTPEQVVVIRAWFARQKGAVLLPIRVFGVEVALVRRIVRAYQESADVVSDPITEEGAKDLPGADGHAAIRGLYEPDKKKRSSPAYKAMLDRLATSCHQVYPYPATTRSSTPP